MACTRELPFDRGQFQPELVVNGLLSPDSVMAVYVHQTVPLDPGAWRAVSEAEVLIYEAGQNEPVRLTHRGGGRYEADGVYPSIGGIYELRVDARSLGQARAVDTVPPKPVVWGVEMTPTGIINQEDYPLVDFHMILENDLSQSVFWDLAIILRNEDNLSGGLYSMNFFSGVVLPDPVIAVEGYLDVNPFSFVFSNQLMDSSIYSLQMRMAGLSYRFEARDLSPFAPDLIRKPAILLRRTSAAYYQHQKAWVRHHYQQPIGSRLDNYVQLLFGGEPTPLYSNVEGAHGVFAAFSTVVAEMKLIR
ncbi:MAG: hypothetical protein OHK0039_24030 [Bacteroidia bacterium]